MSATTQPTLANRRVALAGAADDAFTPAPPLLALDAEVTFYPCADSVPPADTTDFDQALRQATSGAYDWLVFPTSGAVRAVAARLGHLGLKATDLRNIKIAAFGTMTRLVIHELLSALVIATPDTASHAELATAMQLTPGARLLVIQPARARTDWTRLFKDHQATVTSVAGYRLMLGQGGDPLPAMLWAGEVDAIAFVSENNVRHFIKRLQSDGGSLSMLDHVTVACIDPQTAASARALNLHVQVVPTDHTPAGLAHALAQYLTLKAVRSGA